MSTKVYCLLSFSARRIPVMNTKNIYWASNALQYPYIRLEDSRTVKLPGASELVSVDQVDAILNHPRSKERKRTHGNNNTYVAALGMCIAMNQSENDHQCLNM